jgi:hypothetical protein
MPFVGIGTLPPPFSPESVPLPPETGGGGTLACGWGVGGKSQFRRGAYTVVLFICTYFVVLVVPDAGYAQSGNDRFLAYIPS